MKISKDALVRINFKKQNTYPFNPLLQNTSIVANELIYLIQLAFDEGWDCLYLNNESQFSKRITMEDLVQVCMRGFDIEIKNFYNEHKVLEKYEFIITPAPPGTTDNYIRIADTYILPVNYICSLLYKKTKEYTEALKNPHKFTEDYFQLMIEETVYIKKTIKFLNNLIKNRNFELEQAIINFIISLL